MNVLIFLSYEVLLSTEFINSLYVLLPVNTTEQSFTLECSS